MLLRVRGTATSEVGIKTRQSGDSFLNDSLLLHSVCACFDMFLSILITLAENNNVVPAFVVVDINDGLIPSNELPLAPTWRIILQLVSDS